MAPLLVVLTLSESFSELWPTLAESTGTRLRAIDAANELGTLDDACALLIAAGGMEGEILPALDQVIRGNTPAVGVVGIELDHRFAISVIRSGADNYFSLPADLGALRGWVTEQVDRYAGSTGSALVAAEGRARYDFSRIIGRSPAIVEALQRASRIIPTPTATVLITGETGTGKELMAKAIHYNGPRASKPLLEINCSALPENLLEAELFGYEAGAFTDARTAKPGLLEVADGGTVFLDEIGDLSPSLQGKLLRVLEDKRVRRLGSVRDQLVDVRIIAATHVDLYSASLEGTFRQDLYYRLSVLPIHLPPLRERGDDILMIASDFQERFSNQYRIPSTPFPNDVRRALLGHTWPGNIRELRNAIERAVLMGDGQVRREYLFTDLERSGGYRPQAPGIIPFPAPLESIASAAARAMTEYCGGNKSEAAKALGISRRHLYVLLKKGEG